MKEREKIGIVCDSAAMISPNEAEKLGVEVVPMWVHFEDEHYNDHQISATEVKRIFEQKGQKVYPSTSSPSPGEFMVAYDKRLNFGAEQILSIHVAKNIRPGTFNAAKAAAIESRAKHELDEDKIKVMDSKQVALAFGFLVKESINLITSGEKLEATVKHLEDVRLRLKTIGTVKDLRWSEKTAGIPSWLKNKFQDIMNNPVMPIAPIMQIADGKWGLKMLSRRRKAMARIAELTLSSGKIEQMTIFQFDAQNEAEELAYLISKSTNYKPDIVEAPASIAAGAGPGFVGISQLLAK